MNIIKVLAAAALILVSACGGGDDDKPEPYTDAAWCAVPDSQASPYYCIMMAHTRPGQRVTVTVDGRVIGTDFVRSVAIVYEMQPAPEALALRVNGQFTMTREFVAISEGWQRVGWTTEQVSNNSELQDMRISYRVKD